MASSNLRGGESRPELYVARSAAQCDFVFLLLLRLRFKMSDTPSDAANEERPKHAVCCSLLNSIRDFESMLR